MSTSTTITQRDLLAGAKAGYERFYSFMDSEPSCSWAELTQQRQEHWLQVVKAAFREMQRVQSQRARKRLLYPIATRRIAPRGRLNPATRRTIGYP